MNLELFYRPESIILTFIIFTCTYLRNNLLPQAYMHFILLYASHFFQNTTAFNVRLMNKVALHQPFQLLRIKG